MRAGDRVAWQWAVWAVALALGCAAAAGGAWAALRWHGQAADLLAQKASLLAALPKQARQPASDFASTLGPPVNGGKLIQLLYEAAQRAGATIAAVSVSEHPASPTELGRTEVTLQLSGPYAASLRMLQELHDRLPALQVRRMKLQTTAAPDGQVQASLVLSVWSAPMAAASSAAR